MTQATPWSDLKVAYGINNPDALWKWDCSQARNKRRLPAGWELNETDSSGARTVAVFRIDHAPTVAEGERIAALLIAIKAIELVSVS